jgi:hypothetical protein
MFKLENVKKVEEGTYTAESKPCPTCGTVLTTTLEGSQLFLYNQGAFIQTVLSHLNADDRERFQSGYCKTDWDAMFPAEDDEDEYEED